MTQLVLTKYGGTFIGPVAVVLGWLMNGIFIVLEKLSIPNIGLAIIFFTIAVYLCMLPLTIKQQKFSKLSAKMNPELQDITKKYKDKKDNESMMKMQEETKAVYAKYGVSQTGSCLPLLIQMPIMFALYRVIYAMPAYVTSIKDTYSSLVMKLSTTPGVAEYFNNRENFSGVTMFAKQFTNDKFVSGSEYMQNTLIDVLNRASSVEWTNLATSFPDLSTEITNVSAKISTYNNFLGLNIGDSPSVTIREAFTSGSYLLILGALLIPVLSALTQWINTKLMPQPATSEADKDNPMMASMKTMNVTMPIFSAIMCFSLPAGMGLYWIAGSVVRSIQQVVINKHIDKLDIDAVIEENKAKYEEKMKATINNTKNAVAPSTLKDKAKKNTKGIGFDSETYEKVLNENKSKQIEEVEQETKKSKKNDNATKGSISAKANKLNKNFDNN